MKTREEYIALITSHAEELQNTFGITSLRLFGSVARNQHHDGSDVDIYVEMPPKFFLIVRLKAYLEALLGCPVDIIRKHQHLNPFLLKEIKREGIEVIVPYKNKWGQNIQICPTLTFPFQKKAAALQLYSYRILKNDRKQQYIHS